VHRHDDALYAIERIISPSTYFISLRQGQLLADERTHTLNDVSLYVCFVFLCLAIVQESVEFVESVWS